MKQIQSLETLIINLSRFPGVGRKSAERMAYFILKSDTSVAHSLSSSILNIKEKIKFCKKCFNISETELCPICQDSGRDTSILCVVEEFTDLFAIEKSGVFKGLYHVLGGTLSPLKGITPEYLKINELCRRIEHEPITEIIIATNPTVDGDATALYLNRELEKFGKKITRLGLGIPIGGSLEYADDVTLKKSLERRTSI